VGGDLSPRGGSLRPLAQGRGGGRRDSAWGGRGSVRHQAAHERGDARRGGTGAHRGGDWGCGGGHVGRGHNACRAPEEEEAGLLHPQVSDRSPRHHVFERRVPDFSSLCSQGGAHRASPRTCQGVEVGRGRSHEAALIEGAAGGREHGDNGE
jgi:hypothetical protein